MDAIWRPSGPMKPAIKEEIRPDVYIEVEVNAGRQLCGLYIQRVHVLRRTIEVQ
jgi:hypothetical protein